jgi:hypothetical protein
MNGTAMTSRDRLPKFHSYAPSSSCTHTPSLGIATHAKQRAHASRNGYMMPSREPVRRSSMLTFTRAFKQARLFKFGNVL